VTYYPLKFGGTSVAAPHIAGAAALVWGLDLSQTADQVYAVLKERAAEPGTLAAARESGLLGTTMDPGWGWGRVYLGEPPPPTVVQLAHFGAEPEGAAIRLSWQTTSETALLGFNLHRRALSDGPETRLNASLIPSAVEGAPGGAVYTWLDGSVEPGRTYQYRLELLGAWGSSFTDFVEATAEPAARDRIYLPLVPAG
jgi:subtilisin family serine protease